MKIYKLPSLIIAQGVKIGRERNDMRKSKGSIPKNFEYVPEQAHIIGAVGERMFTHLYPQFKVDGILEHAVDSIDFVINGKNYDLKNQIFYQKPNPSGRVYNSYWFNVKDVNHYLQTEKQGLIACGMDNIPSRARTFYLFGLIDIRDVTRYNIKRMKDPRKDAYCIPFDDFDDVEMYL